jgi:uncharacterized membrane protein
MKAKGRRMKYEGRGETAEKHLILLIFAFCLLTSYFLSVLRVLCVFAVKNPGHPRR